MPDYLPLQSHGLKKTKQVWEPPKSRSDFWIADERDECWMRPLMEPGDGGYWGTLETVPDERYPVDLYDVRDERGDLIGYSRLNPVEQYELNPYPLQVSVVGTGGSNYYEGPQDAYTEKIIPLHTMQWHAGGQTSDRYLCWKVRLSDALHLIEAGWIVCIGPDRKNSFFHEMRIKVMEQAYRMGLDPRRAW